MPDVVIVGAGIAGIATAWALTQRGINDIVMVDRRPPLTLTSNRPEANYRTWWPHPEMVALATRSLEIVRDLIDDGAEITMDRRGYLYVSESEAGSEALGGIVGRHPASRVSAAAALDDSEIHRRWPHLGPSVCGGIFVVNAGGIDTVALGNEMLERAVRAGVRVIQDDIATFERSGADLVVNAAGPYAREVAQRAGSDLDLETVLRQKVVIRDRAGVVPRAAPFTITLDGRFLPWSVDERRRLSASADGRLLLEQLPPGIHVKPDDTAGSDALKVGWAWDQCTAAPSDNPQTPPDFPRMAQLGVSTFIPTLSANSPVIAHEGGFYARTPDGRPLIGWYGDRQFAVAGLAGFGAMMACAAGELAAAIITDSDVDTAAAEAFAPDRFRDPSYLDQIRSGSVPTGEL